MLTHGAVHSPRNPRFESGSLITEINSSLSRRTSSELPTITSESVGISRAQAKDLRNKTQLERGNARNEPGTQRPIAGSTQEKFAVTHYSRHSNPLLSLPHADLVVTIRTLREHSEQSIVGEVRLDDHRHL